MPAQQTRTDTALLLVRLAVGLSFLLHGLDKLGDLNGVEQNFDGLGIPAPALMAPFVALTETIGGALLIVGLITPVAGLALGIDMIVAYATVHAGKGFFVSDGGWELVFLLGTASFGLMISGAGRFSVDAALKLADRVTPNRSSRSRDHRLGRTHTA